MFTPVLTKLATLLAVFVFANAGPTLAVEPQARTFYVQMVHGSDSAQPPVPQATLIGPKLSQRLRAVFPWKSYWELKRASVKLEPGRKTRTRMTPDREVEIRYVSGEQLEIQIFREGKPTRLHRQAASTPFWIVGGDKAERQSWFIVVRQDKPTPPQ